MKADEAMESVEPRGYEHLGRPPGFLHIRTRKDR
jgi:hypothetical protein